MFNFIKDKFSKTQTQDQKLNNEQKTAEKPQSLFSRLKNSLVKTRKSFTQSIADLFIGKKQIDDELLDELENILLTADLGIEVTHDLIAEITDKVNRKQLQDFNTLAAQLKTSLSDIITPNSIPLDVELPKKKPFVLLMTGVNGAGKTTTIGKLAKQFQNQGKSVMLAAGDTFRAAAIEQLKTWGERNDVPVISQHTGADSASVIYDAYNAAKARGFDVLIADTAGRLHTQDNLMEELKKVVRVIKKIDDSAPHETMLVLDASIGQNALQQAIKFNEAISITGLTLTKLDGTAKGGIIFAICKKLNIPLRYIGIGEKIDDLREFNTNEFIEALFSMENTKDEAQ